MEVEQHIPYMLRSTTLFIFVTYSTGVRLFSIWGFNVVSQFWLFLVFSLCFLKGTSKFPLSFIKTNFLSLLSSWPELSTHLKFGTFKIIVSSIEVPFFCYSRSLYHSTTSWSLFGSNRRFVSRSPFNYLCRPTRSCTLSFNSLKV